MKVIEGDALDVDLRGEVPETEVKVVASLPYNVSVPILFRLIEERARVPGSHGDAAAARSPIALLATVDTRAYGAPSVLVPALRRAARPLQSRLVGVLSASAGRFRRCCACASRRRRACRSTSRALMTAIVRAAFNQRRKMLRNAVQTLAAPLALPPAVWDEVFAAAGVDGRARGETLDVATFARLSDAAGRALDAAGVRAPRAAVAPR